MGLHTVDTINGSNWIKLNQKGLFMNDVMLLYEATRTRVRNIFRIFFKDYLMDPCYLPYFECLDQEICKDRRVAVVAGKSKAKALRDQKGSKGITHVHCQGKLHIAYQCLTLLFYCQVRRASFLHTWAPGIHG